MRSHSKTRGQGAQPKLGPSPLGRFPARLGSAARGLLSANPYAEGVRGCMPSLRA